MKDKENTDAIEDEIPEERTESVKKKAKIFSVKEFRKNLKGEHILNALQSFHDLCAAKKKDHDYILEYLQGGGSCLELLQLMEEHADTSHVVLEIVYLILLEINSKYPQYTVNAHDACKYFLSTYMTMTNKMLSLNSTRPERIMILRMLTAVAALSPNFAKDILIHVNINAKNLGFLTNSNYSKDAVRSAFINFLMAFLIDGYYPTLSALLEKRGVLTSIIKGLMHDDADVVCVVMNTLRNHVLENPLVSKTVKMKTFSTPVIKDVVQLYNWKGPTLLKKTRKRNRKVLQYPPDVDPQLKLRVSDCVHEFLLILCTSHKYGVIFRDPQIGLGRKSQNSLVFTVLDSLDTPWKHSYASELVIKICGACPDLTKTIWTQLKESLEPRRTEQWLSALRFTEKLFHELKPDRIADYMKDFTPNQLAQITQMLIAPTPILKTLTEPTTFSNKYLKYHIVKVLSESINSIVLYLNTANKMITAENYKTYKKLITEHTERNFPNSTSLLQNYMEKDDCINDYDYLDGIFHLLSIYQTVCPQLLDFTTNLIDFKDILDYAKEISGDNRGILEMKIVKLYLDHDPVAFLPNTELFEQVLPFILDCYCRLHDEASFKVLEKIFWNTGAFQSYETEIRIWITSLRNIDKCTDAVTELFKRVLKLVLEKSMLYFAELSEIKANLPGVAKETIDLNEILESFSNEDDIKIVLKPSIIRHVYLSPIILSILECLDSIEKSKLIKTYLQYAFLNVLHLQTDPSLFLAIIEKYNCKFLSSNVLEYLRSWNETTSDKILLYNKGKIELLSKFSSALIKDDLKPFLSENMIDSEDILNLFYMSSFYITNFARNKNLDKKLVDNSISYIKFCFTKEINIDVLNHPVFLHYFSPLHVEKGGSTNALITEFVINVIKEMPQNDDVLEQYRIKLFNSLKRMLNKASKYKNFQPNNFMNIINTLNLTTEQCFELCNHIPDLQVENFINDEQNLSIFVPIITFLLNYLNQLNKNYEQVLEKKTIEAISNNISFLISKNENFDIAAYIKSFTTYLETFPHCLEYIPKELFVSLTQKLEYNKECVELLILIFENKFDELLNDMLLNIDNITTKKGVILPILDVVQNFNVDEENLKLIYDKIEPLLLKTIQKPQKAGQHFEKHYKGIAYLLNKFFTFEKYKNFIEKIHKYDTTEPFHVNILKIIFKKAIIKSEKYIKNAILTFIHLTMNFFKKKTKTEEDWVKFADIITMIKDICNDISNDSNINCDYTQILQNETFKTFCKFCLKFGLSGHEHLLGILTVLVKKLPFPVDDSQLLLEMTVSHSEFLDWVLNEDSTCKTEILNLMHELFKSSQELMTKQYLPILLAAYRATLRNSDRIIFKILRMFEANPSQTNFYDFNPFLWGKSAANHYSVRSDLQKALWRQPRTGTVLDILELHLVLNTINKYPLNLSLNTTSMESCATIDDSDNIYDLTFLIPLFTLLLAPENAVQTYRFTKNGALSLTISALSSQDEETRKGACFVLYRFYHHVEARQSGKDNQLWLRFIEAICKGMATMEDLKLNKFASTFLARMALVLTQPTHVMYVPLSQYLSAKSTLDFSMIPELYTLLHSPDINYKEHRSFILEVLRDGLSSVEDFHVALRSMSFKLIMEQYTSVVTDIDAKILILQIIEKATSLKEGTKFLCSNYGLLSWLYNVVIKLDKTNQKQFLISLKVVLNIINCKDVDLFIIVLLISQIIDNISKYSVTDDALLVLLKILCLLFKISNEWLSEDRLKILIKAVNCKQSEYILKYGGKYIKFDLDNLSLESADSNYFIQYLTLSWLKKKS
ncbi:nucleolar preribosomal-associated protein 1 [Holotrichia oblita]|uniref:Nucleolar preribosomal-associated protein 1 n=1 Tax=Holotrichia oblita TaxID=644536 RepID=A0ACB9SPW7_HOLOL|nr:nucleolar preribosomal-associated protein 1 [Holotrichia oblita]